MRNLHPLRDRGTAPSGEEKDFVAVTPRSRPEGPAAGLGTALTSQPPTRALGALSLPASGSQQRTAAAKGVVPPPLRSPPGGKAGGGAQEAGRRVLQSPRPPPAVSLPTPPSHPHCSLPSRNSNPKPGRAGAGYLRFFLNSYCFLIKRTVAQPVREDLGFLAGHGQAWGGWPCRGVVSAPSSSLPVEWPYSEGLRATAGRGLVGNLPGAC